MGSEIGQITNKGASAYALLPILENKYGIESKEYQLTYSRLKQSCKAQSQQIDRTKIGRQVKSIPKIWITKQKIEEEDSEEIKTQKKVYNSILLNRKPYFFKYLYKKCNKEYRYYLDKSNKQSLHLFGKTFEELLAQETFNSQEKDFIDNFYEWCPLIISDSNVNLLCRSLEEFNSNIKYCIKNNSEFTKYYIYKNPHITYTSQEAREVLKAIEEIKEKLKQKYKENYTTEEGIENILNVREEIERINNNIYSVTNILIDDCYKKNNKKNLEILWKYYGNIIFENLINNNDKDIYFPFKSINGNINYMGYKYELRRIEL